MVVRHAAEHDVKELAEVAVLSWRTAFAGLVASDFLASMSVSGRAEGFTRVLARAPTVELWVAEDGHRLVGYGTIGPDRSPHTRPSALELYALYVRPEEWRRGVGRRLHDHLLGRLNHRGAHRVVLWVLELNAPARDFYEARGWEQTGHRRELALGDQSYSAVQYARLIPPPR